MTSILQKIRNRIRRFTNQLHRYDFAPCNNGWQKYGDAPVYGNAATGTIYDPYAVKVNGLYYIFASERRTGHLIRIESPDGRRWGNPQSVLQGIAGTWQHHVNRGCVLVKDGKWHLWFCGMHDGVSQIGYATSLDGIHFERVTDEVVLKAAASYEGISVMNPSVIWDDATASYRMWYSAGENYEPDVICYAESHDGIHWTKHNGPVIAASSDRKWEQYKVGGCHVIKVDDGYQIYYIGYQNLDVARICVAHSCDGLVWNRHNNNLLIAPTKGAWDGDATYKPTIIASDGRIFLWYNGRRGCDEYIGLALHDSILK